MSSVSLQTNSYLAPLCAGQKLTCNFCHAHPPGFEPRITVPKTVVISISPWMRSCCSQQRYYSMKQRLDVSCVTLENSMDSNLCSHNKYGIAYNFFCTSSEKSQARLKMLGAFFRLSHPGTTHETQINPLKGMGYLCFMCGARESNPNPLLGRQLFYH